MKTTLRLALSLCLAVALGTGCGANSPSASASPAIGRVQPQRGPTAGGTLAVVRGNNFNETVQVLFGGQPAAFVKVVDATTLTVLTPPGLAGKVSLVVQSGGKQTSLTDAFEYYALDGSVAAPTLSAIAPNTGPVEGGTVALVTGTGLQEGALLFLGRSPAAEVTVADAQSLSARLPAGQPGAQDVELTNPDGQTTKLSMGFAYSDVAGDGPALTEVSPLAGATGGGTLVNLVGSNLQAGALVFFGGRTATAVTAVPGGLTAVTPPGAPGVVDVSVTNPDGRSSLLTRGYNYYVGGPLVSRVTPGFGPADGGTEVLVHGRSFSDPVLVTFGGRLMSGLRRIDERTIAGVAPAGPVGAADVRVENDDGQSDVLVAGWAWGTSTPTAVLEVARVTPEIGPVAGSTRVTLVGSGFTPGAEVRFGSAPATSVQVVGGSTLSCLTPAGAIGPVEVTVTLPGGQAASRSLGFWYFDPTLRGPTPSLAAVTPALGPRTGGTTVLVLGNNFVTGARVYFGDGEATGVVVADRSTLSAVTPAAQVNGPVDVRVMNPDGQLVTQNQGFVYVDPAVIGPAPTLSAVTPSTGGSADQTAVTLTAQGVLPGATVFVGGVQATGVTLGTGTLSATFPPHAPGPLDVVITNPDGQSATLANGFTYTRSPPLVTSVSPATVPLAGGLKVFVSGRGFVSGATVSFDGPAQAATFVDDTLVLAMAPAHAAATVDVKVTNPDGQSHVLAGALTYANITLGPAPTLSSIAPSRGPATGGTVALLTGTGLGQGVRVLFGSVPGNGVTVMSDGRLSVTVPAGVVGPVDITVINPDGQSARLAGGFTRVDPAQLGPAPSLASVTPGSGVASGGTQVVLAGDGFQAGPLVFFGGYAASAAQAQGATIATATSPTGPTGKVDVALTNADGQSVVLARAFEYLPGPTVISLFPSRGPTTGGTAFTVAGSGFAPGVRVFIGSGEAPQVTVASSSVITGVTPAGPVGAAAARVVNADGQEVTLAQAFTYEVPPPPPLGVTGVTPESGAVGGGARVTVSGSGFGAGASVSFGGVAATNVQVVDDGSLTCTVPAGVIGPAEVAVTMPGPRVARLSLGYWFFDPTLNGSTPTLASLSPASGPATGGTMLLMRGTGFSPSARVYFGALQASGVVVIDAQTLTAVTPAAAALGPVDVRVMNPDGRVVSLRPGFVYVDLAGLGAAPVVSGLTPSTGGTSGATAATLTTQHVQPEAQVFVGGVPAGNVVLGTGSSAGTVTATFPPRAPGVVDVVITNPDGQSGRLTGGFTYAQSPPVITAVTPNTIPLGGGLRVLVAGSGFTPGLTVTVDGAAAQVTYVDDTLLFVTMPPHGEGQVTMTITNVDGQTFTFSGGVTYSNISLGAAPTLTSVVPNRGPTTGGTVALVVGANFAPGARVLFGSAAATEVTVMSATRLSAVAPAGAAGAVDVTVINVDGQSARLVQGFTRVDPSQLGPAPVLASVTPGSGVSGGGTQTVLTGSGFQAGMYVYFGGYSASAGQTQNVNIATATTPAGPTGRVNVAVTNPDGRSAVLAGGYQYTPRPALQSIFPAVGPTTGGTPFTIAGTGFALGARVYFANAEASAVTVGSSSVITGVTPSNAQGQVALRVVNPDAQEGTLAQAFTYNPPPSLVSVRPGGGPVAGGTTLAVTGTGFQPGASVKLGALPAAQVRVVSPTLLFAVTPAASAGAVPVEVVNGDGQSSQLADAFRYDAVDALARESSSYPDVVMPMARDDAAYETDATIANLSSRPVTVTVAAYDAAGALLGSRALASPIAGGGRVALTDVLRFVGGGSAQVNKTGSVVVSADGPVTASLQVTDRTSGDAFLVPGVTAARSAARLLVPYASSVGGFKTWLAVTNVGAAAATVDVVARRADGTPAGTLPGVVLAPAATYTNDDLLAAMSVTGAQVTLEVSSPGGSLLAAARSYSNGRLGGLVQARPLSDASTSQALGYVPDTTLESSVLYLVNTDSTATATATIDLRSSPGQSLGTRTVTVPANGFVAVPDLARTLLSRVTPTQTVSSAIITSSRTLMSAALVLTAANSDLRLYNGRTGGGVRMLLPGAEPRTGLTVANLGLAETTVEVSLRVDSGAARGLPFLVNIPARGLFNAPLVLSTLGAGSSSGVVEVRSLNGIPVAAIARVANDASGVLGDAVELGPVVTTPKLATISPPAGPATGGTMARLSGSFFLPRAQVFFGSLPAPRSFVSGDGTAVAVSPAGSVGNVVDVALMNFDGAVDALPTAFGFLDPAVLAVAPSLSSVGPTQVSVRGGTAIQISGANFQSQVQAFVGLTPVSGATQVNPNRVDGAAPPGSVGLADVTVTNPDGRSATLTNAVQYVVPPPTLTAVTPSSGPGLGGTLVRLTGSAFQVGAQVTFGGTGVPTATVLSDTEIELTTPVGADGPVTVTVVNPDGKSVTLNAAYSYIAAPNPVQVSPTSGPITGGSTITITGTYFRAGATVKVGPNDCIGVSVQPGGTAITCATPTGTSGPVAVRVTNPDGQEGLVNNGFTYLAPVPPPSVSGVSPAYGPVTGGSQVTVLGANFQAGASVRFGTALAPAVNVISPAAIVVTAPGQAGPGPVGVTVTNPDTQFSTLGGGFTYFQPADLPAITVISLTPNQGPTAGGTVVFVSGRGFKAGAQVLFGGTPGTNVQYLGPSALQVTTPARPLGPVNVTVVNPDSSNSTLASGYDFTNGVSFRFPPARLPLTQERGTVLTRFLDVDNDNDLDAFVGRYNSNYDSDGNDQLWLNDGTGTFLRDPNFPGDLRTDTQDAVVADFDGNGTRDVFVLSRNANAQSRFLVNAPTGVFTVRSPAVLSTTALTQRSATVGDLNTDGFLDVYVTAAGNDYMFLNQRDGGFTATRTGLPPINDDSVAACVADYDRDGDDDVFVVNGSNQQATYYLKGPSGFVQAPLNQAPGGVVPVVGGNGTGCIAAQLRPGTNITDLVIVKAGQIYQYLTNDGLGNFTDQAAASLIFRLPQSPPSNNIFRRVDAVDLDLDGDLDLLMHHTDTNPRYQAYMNDGAGFFNLGTASRIGPFLDADGEGSVGDVNADGRPDLLIPGDGTQSRLMLNESVGGLTNRTMKTIPDQSYAAWSAAPGDIDGDGDEDLVIAHGCRREATNPQPVSCRTNTVRVWLNDGAGGFTDETATRLPAVNYNAVDIKLADMDRDGDKDILVGINQGRYGPAQVRSLRLYLNNGSGVFTDVSYPRIPETSNVLVNSIAVADVNNDGAPDILEVSTNVWSCIASYFKLYLNTGNGFFFDVSNQLPQTSQSGPFCSSAAQSYSATFADFNGDGYVDFHVGTDTEYRAKLWFNRGALQPGYFVDVSSSNMPNVNDLTLAAFTGDFNGDTFPDIFSCNSDSDRINLGNAFGVLSDVTATNWPGENQPYPYPVMIAGSFGPVREESCAGADVDGDGDIDVVLGGRGANGFNHRNRLYSNSGAAVFTDLTTTAMPYDTADTLHVKFFNANGDSKPDLFIGNAGQPYVLLNGP